MSVSRARLPVIFLTILIDLIGFGIILPILPYLAKSLGSAGLGLGVLMGSFSAMQFLSTAILGRLSDRVGRRPVLLVTMVVNAAGYVLFAFAGSYAALLVARVISGLASGNISVAQAYVADVSAPENRSKAMGVIGAAFGIGFVLGPALGAVTGHFWGHTAPGLVAATLSALNLVLAWRILPESLDAAHRTRRPLLDLSHIGEAVAHPRLKALMGVWLLAPFAFAGFSAVMPLHTAAVFGWGERELGASFVVIGVFAAVIQGWAFGRIARVYGDHRLLVVGVFGMAVVIGSLWAVPSSAGMYLAMGALAVANSVFGPAVMGTVSLLADPTEQGTVLGAAQALAALGRLAGPVAYGAVFDASGAVVSYLGMGLVMALAGVFALRVPHSGALHVDAAPVPE